MSKLWLSVALLAGLAAAAYAHDPLDPRPESSTIMGGPRIVRDPIPAKAQFGFVLEPSKAPAPLPIGSYARGCLAGAISLPVTGPAWQVMRPSRNRNWGHTSLIQFIEQFANDMRDREGWPGLLIGDMSQPRGGPMLTGHASHQIGLDVDIWYRPMPDHVLTTDERETLEPELLAEPDGAAVLSDHWNEGWVRLLRRAASYPVVARIFVHPAIKKALCETPTLDRQWMSKVRAYFGHNDHFHIRIHCPPGSPSCIPQADPGKDDGCGTELAYWMRAIKPPPVVVAKANPAPLPSPGAAAATPAKPGVAAKPPAPPKPHYLTLADMPAACAGVLADGSPALLTSVAPDDAPLPEPSPLRSTRTAQP